MKFFNRKETLEKRRVLRKKQTKEEALLWKQLRGKRLMKFKFFRQYGIGPYIADFYCPFIKLVIEADGSHHYKPENIGYDRVRSEYMQNLGIKTLRFTNREINENICGVLNNIVEWINENSPRPPL